MKFLHRKKHISDSSVINQSEMPAKIDYDDMIERINEENKARSDAAFKFYQSNINNVDPESLNLNDFDRSPLTSTEEYFLEYLNGLPIKNPAIAQYWYYEYALNYEQEIKKFLGQKLLKISVIPLEKLKVPELKEILKKYNLPVSGKKSELCSRIANSVPEKELREWLSLKGKFYCLTDVGKKMTKDLIPSATKNLELENECIRLIMSNDYASAYRKVADFRRNSPASSGLGIDWEREYHSGLSDQDCERYRKMVEDNAFNYTLTRDREIELKIRAGIVFCHMMGLGQNDMWKLIKRIYFESNKNFDEDAKNIISGRLL